jgi:hypothetical protein
MKLTSRKFKATTNKLQHNTIVSPPKNVKFLFVVIRATASWGNETKLEYVICSENIIIVTWSAVSRTSQIWGAILGITLLIVLSWLRPNRQDKNMVLVGKNTTTTFWFWFLAACLEQSGIY